MLTHEELRHLLTSTETARVERTVSTGDMDKFSEAICAFSNDMPGSGKPGYLHPEENPFSILGLQSEQRKVSS